MVIGFNASNTRRVGCLIAPFMLLVGVNAASAQDSQEEGTQLPAAVAPSDSKPADAQATDADVQADIETAQERDPFAVPENADAVYIGNITINMVKNQYITVIEDKSKELVSAYKTRFPGYLGHITTSLLQLPDKLGNFSRIINECDEKWGLIAQVSTGA